MTDYEDLILQRQERRDLWEDGCIDEDDCDHCNLLDRCRAAADGKGEFPRCPMDYCEEE